MVSVYCLVGGWLVGWYIGCGIGILALVLVYWLWYWYIGFGIGILVDIGWLVGVGG
jgi:hypothetical protein